MEIKFGIGLVGGFRKGEREQAGFAIGKGKLFGIKQRLIRSVSSHRPLERLKTLQPLVGHASEQGSKGSNLAINFRRMLILPVRAETVGDVLNDLPIGAAALQRLKHFVEPLDSSFGAGEGAFFFQTWTGWQHHIGIMAGGAEEDVLHDEEGQIRETIAEKTFV